ALGNNIGAIGAGDAAKAVRAALDRMMALGGAHIGDKTLLDALAPFADALAAEEARPVREAWNKAGEAARAAAEATKALLPKVGRARPQAARSLGTPDAGAVSLAMCISAAGETEE
ncbi:MAG: DAK2 domain-containing protein, partial [Clostridiales bacterium]|nr:DAK2 domain-containing protein [Clostridiales bacterium]